MSDEELATALEALGDDEDLAQAEMPNSRSYGPNIPSLAAKRIRELSGWQEKALPEIKEAMSELGVPQPSYPQNVTNAYEILCMLLDEAGASEVGGSNAD